MDLMQRLTLDSCWEGLFRLLAIKKRPNNKSPEWIANDASCSYQQMFVVENRGKETTEWGYEKPWIQGFEFIDDFKMELWKTTGQLHTAGVISLPGLTFSVQKNILSKFNSHNGALCCNGTDNTASIFSKIYLVNVTISSSWNQFEWDWLSPKWMVYDNQLRWIVDSI